MLEVEEEIAETSLRSERQKWQLEEKWEELRLRKEREAEGEMRELILSEQDNLVAELERLREEAREKEENAQLLMGELIKVTAARQELKAEKEEKMLLLAMEEEENLSKLGALDTQQHKALKNILGLQVYICELSAKEEVRSP